MARDTLCAFLLAVVSLCIAFYQLGRTTLRQVMKQELQIEFESLNNKIDALVASSKAKDATISDLRAQLAAADQTPEVLTALRAAEARIDAALPPPAEPAPVPTPAA